MMPILRILNYFIRKQSSWQLHLKSTYALLNKHAEFKTPTSTG